MVSFEIFVKAMPPSISELKVLPSFCFAFKIPDDVAASSIRIMKTCLMTFEFDLGHYDLENEKKRHNYQACCTHQQSSKGAEIVNSISVC